MRDAGGEVKIFSSMHISGQRESIVAPSMPMEYALTFDCLTELAQLSGIAAILRFPMPELEDENDDDGDDDDDSDS